MSVEELAKELFPLLETDKIGNNPYITYNTEQLAKQEGFIAGYHQAEKDLELTWEDIDWIVGEAICNTPDNLGKEQICKEVLKRFKDFKERKDGDKG